jgi:hypothetical protein
MVLALFAWGVTHHSSHTQVVSSRRCGQHSRWGSRYREA